MFFSRKSCFLSGESVFLIIVVFYVKSATDGVFFCSFDFFRSLQPRNININDINAKVPVFF